MSIETKPRFSTETILTTRIHEAIIDLEYHKFWADQLEAGAEILRASACRENLHCFGREDDGDRYWECTSCVEQDKHTSALYEDIKRRAAEHRSLNYAEQRKLWRYQNLQAARAKRLARVM